MTRMFVFEPGYQDIHIFFEIPLVLLKFNHTWGKSWERKIRLVGTLLMPFYPWSSRSCKKIKETSLELKGVKIVVEGKVERVWGTLNERESKKENKEIGEGNDAVYIQMNKLIIILRWKGRKNGLHSQAKPVQFISTNFRLPTRY